MINEKKLCKQFNINIKDKRKAPNYVNDLTSKIENARSKLLLSEGEIVMDFFIKTSRENLLFDSYRQIMDPKVTIWDLKQRIKVKKISKNYNSLFYYANNTNPLIHQKTQIEYENEKGKDYGGKKKIDFIILKKKKKITTPNNKIIFNFSNLFLYLYFKTTLGMSRDWFYQLGQRLLDEELGLFIRPCEDRYEYQINPFSGTEFNKGEKEISDLEMFTFVGRIMAMAMYHAKFLEFPMVQPFWRMLQMGASSLNGETSICSLNDLKSIDPIYYKSLEWMLENDVTPLDSDFTITQETKEGKMVVHNLKVDENGDPIALTNDNKQLYINLAIQYKMRDSVVPQMKKILEGFYQFLPDSILKNFQIEEIPILFNGNSTIDIEDLRKNTDYDEGLNEWSEIVLWFWEIVEKWDNDKKGNFMQFVTGTKKGILFLHFFLFFKIS